MTHNFKLPNSHREFVMENDSERVLILNEADKGPILLNIRITYKKRTKTWSIGNKVEGTADIDSALESIAHAYYKVLTEHKFKEARIPRIGRKIAILGNYMDSDEYFMKYHKYNKISTDDREKRVFVIGLPRQEKEEYIGTLSYVKFKNVYLNDSTFDTTIKIEEGNLKLHESLDWRMYRIQDNVVGEVYCPECKRVSSSAQDVAFVYISTLGAYCGPCVDHFLLDKDLPYHGLMDF